MTLVPSARLIYTDACTGRRYSDLLGMVDPKLARDMNIVARYKLDQRLDWGIHRSRSGS